MWEEAEWIMERWNIKDIIEGEKSNKNENETDVNLKIINDNFQVTLDFQTTAAGGEI